ILFPCGGRLRLPPRTGHPQAVSSPHTSGGLALQRMRAPAQGTASAGFVALYAFAYAALWLALLTPAIVTLALRIRQLAPENAARSISLVLCVGALVALIGRAPTINMLLLGWCIVQLAFNAVLAAMVAILPDQVPVTV